MSDSIRQEVEQLIKESDLRTVIAGVRIYALNRMIDGPRYLFEQMEYIEKQLQLAEKAAEE